MKKVILSAVVVTMLLFTRHLPAAADWSADLQTAQTELAGGNYGEAFTIYQKAAVEGNNSLAQFNLALFYRNGWGRPVDPVASCVWMEKAAAGSIPAAAHFWAECKEQGVGQSPNPAEAVVWYEKAVDLGYLASLCSLGRLYVTGQGVPQDPERGLNLCQKAAEQNILPAQIQLGLLYLEGEPAIRDFAKAYQWFIVAAEKNDPIAYYYLGIMDRDGLGRPKSPEQARYWFESAASQGYLPAYYPTAFLYYNAPVDPQTDKPAAENLAKAYLWLSATLKRSSDRKDKEKAAEMLKRVLEIMPGSWRESLDAELSKHLQKYSSGS